MYIVKFYDGSKLTDVFKTKAEAIKEARKGLHDWMNDDDHIGQIEHEDSTELYVIGGDEGESDACARVIKVKVPL